MAGDGRGGKEGTDSALKAEGHEENCVVTISVTCHLAVHEIISELRMLQLPVTHCCLLQNKRR